MTLGGSMSGILEGGKEMSHHNVHLASRPDTKTSMVTKSYSVGGISALFFELLELHYELLFMSQEPLELYMVICEIWILLFFLSF